MASRQAATPKRGPHLVNHFNKWYSKTKSGDLGYQPTFDDMMSYDDHCGGLDNDQLTELGIALDVAHPTIKRLRNMDDSPSSNAHVYTVFKPGEWPNGQGRVVNGAIAEPGYIWSKHPNTTGEEFTKRVAKGEDPEKVYRSIIAEIDKHYQEGKITNRDAKRSANEAFGRLLKGAKRKTAGEWMGCDGCGHEFRDPGGDLFPPCPHCESEETFYAVDPLLEGKEDYDIPEHLDPRKNRALESRRKRALDDNGVLTPEVPHSPVASGISDAPGRVPQVGILGRPSRGAPMPPIGTGTGEVGGKVGSRKQAWSGWGPAQKKQHRAEGWEWDNHLNGYVSSKSPRQFQCSCGNAMAVPGYTNCKCGKIWNSYVIGTGGDRHEAAAEKFICREIPVREDVIVAKKRTARPEPVPITEHDVDRWRHPDKCTVCGKPATGEHVTKDGGIICPEHNLHVHARSRKALTLDLPGGEPFDKEPSRKEWLDDEGGEWPSDHHPKTPKMGPSAKDLYRAPGGKFAPGRPAGPGAFKKKP